MNSAPVQLRVNQSDDRRASIWLSTSQVNGTFATTKAIELSANRDCRRSGGSLAPTGVLTVTRLVSRSVARSLGAPVAGVGGDRPAGCDLPLRAADCELELLDSARSHPPTAAVRRGSRTATRP